MNRQTAVELLPWLLNDTLEADVRRELEEQLEASPELRDELVETLLAGGIYQGRPAAETLIAYSEGRETPGIPRPVLEKLLEADADLREELAMVEASRAALLGGDESAAPGDAEEASDGAANVVTGPWSSAARWRAVALAASLVAAVATGGWLWSFGDAAGQAGLRERVAELEEQLDAGLGAGGQIRAARSVAVSPVQRGTERESIRRSEGDVVLEPPELPAGAERYRELRYVFLAQSGAVVSSLEVPTPSNAESFTVVLPTAELPLGLLDFVVYGVGEEEPELERYPLEVLP